jgi:hypothetical protein
MGSRRLTDERREFAARHYRFVKWTVKRLPVSLFLSAIKALGSKEDVYQTLALEYCRILAALKELWTSEEYADTVPNFMFEQLASYLKKVISYVSHRIFVDITTIDFRVEEDPSLLVTDSQKTLVENKDMLAAAGRLVESAVEPTRTMLKRRLNGENFQQIAKDYNITPTAVGSKVRAWLRLIARTLNPSMKAGEEP